MNKLLFIPLLISFSNTAIALDGIDLYYFANSWGGISASCYGFYILGFPKEESKELFSVYYEQAKESKNKEVYKLMIEKMYDESGPMYKPCKELYPE